MKRKRMITVLFFVWIAVIFLHSLQPSARSEMESNWVVEWLYRLFPFRPSPHLVRKLAHFTEFAVLGVLAAAFDAAWSGALTGWRRFGAAFRFALESGVLTALCDETIQLFVAGRSGQIQDVWIDAAGACTGGAAALLAAAFRPGRRQFPFSGRSGRRNL